MKQQTPRSDVPAKKEKRAMTEGEMEELVRQQTREFKREIEKRFSTSKHNHVFAFPLESIVSSLDSSLNSLVNTETYNLHNQNNMFCLRKKSMSEQLIRPFTPSTAEYKQKSQERYVDKKIQLSIERASALTNRPLYTQLTSNKKSTKSEHKEDQPQNNNSQRFLSKDTSPINKATKIVFTGNNRLMKQVNLPHNLSTNTSTMMSMNDFFVSKSKNLTPVNNISHNNVLNSQKPNDLNKSTQIIQQKIQRIIQDSIHKSSERTSTTASIHQGTNQTLLKLLQKNGMLRQDMEPIPERMIQHPQQFSQKELKPLSTTNRQVSLRQLKSPSYNPQSQKSYFSKHNASGLLSNKSKIAQNDHSNHSVHRTFTQHDSNNTSRSYISNVNTFQQILNTTARGNSIGQRNTTGNCNTSRINQQKSDGKQQPKTETIMSYMNTKIKTLNMGYSPTTTIKGNKSFQENMYANINRIPTQPTESIQNYIQVDNYLNQTRNYQTNINFKQNNDRIKDHMIKIGCITGRNTNDMQGPLHSKYNQNEHPKQISNYSMGF